ncbi:N-acetylglutamate synthase, CG3035 family [Mycobacterium bohemicum]|uniref:GCN5 family acetyltransferase n=1 Tax=Mycobacterium bohemicum TaxID=56425 RepID=A0A1X1RCM0_MYCBE|nr:GNAT family N-acetyltransferase [Mycobacterium bohemicum]MCV6972483.1 GNAT family N-acetyltransferase [Mycobacterium bohemicum]ORV02987.1 GCN5 family acetyltransferase [Mycobacterium bohemicum]
MISWPRPGTRVTVRYRRPAGSVPPLTDAVGHLLEIDPVVRVRTKTGTVVEFAPADAVAVRALTDAPLRTSDIRALEHAAAAAWPGLERRWLNGWFLRAANGVGMAANSAVPLDLSAGFDAVPEIAAWYARRGLTPRLAIPDRLLPRAPASPAERTDRFLVRDVTAGTEPDPAISLSAAPDGAWLEAHPRAVPVDLLTAVIDGEVVFGAGPRALARAAVTAAPDGTRWLGLSAVRATDEPSAARLCRALIGWGGGRGATRAYLVVSESRSRTGPLADSLGFRFHHRRRYVPATVEA